MPVYGLGGMAGAMAGAAIKKKTARKKGARRSGMGAYASAGGMKGAGKPKLRGGPGVAGAAIASAMPKIKPMTTRPPVSVASGRKTNKIKPMRKPRKY